MARRVQRELLVGVRAAATAPDLHLGAVAIRAVGDVQALAATESAERVAGMGPSLIARPAALLDGHYGAVCVGLRVQAPC